MINRKRGGHVAVVNFSTFHLSILISWDPLQLQRHSTTEFHFTVSPEDQIRKDPTWGLDACCSALKLPKWFSSRISTPSGNKYMDLEQPVYSYTVGDASKHCSAFIRRWIYYLLWNTYCLVNPLSFRAFTAGPLFKDASQCCWVLWYYAAIKRKNQVTMLQVMFVF